MHRRLALLPGIMLALVLLGFPALARSSPSPAPAAAPIGTAFTYQGELKQNGAPVNQSCDFQFTAFDAASGGSQVGTTQAVNNVPVTNGLFTAYPIDFGASAYTNALWLQVAAACPTGSSFTTFPLQRLTPGPNAVFASTASSAATASSATTATSFSGNLAGDVTGTQSSTTVANVGGVTAANVATGANRANGATSAPTPSALVARDASSNFSAGTITAALNGNATSATTATNFSGSLSGDVTGTQGSTVVGKLQGRAVASTAPANGDVLKFNGTQWAPGADNSTTYTAGSGLSLSGTTFSVSFGGDGSAATVSRSDHTHVGQTWTCSTTSYGALIGESTATDLNTAGLFGVINSSTSQGTGVFGVTNSTNSLGVGVFGGASANTAGAAAKGVWGEADGPSGISVYGKGFNGAKAAQFDGNVQVNGTLSKTAGSFKIDDPLDPTNQYLYHSFVESPDMMNVYNGNAVLDANGQATIELPPYFQALNTDYRYQLTPVGGAAPNLYVSQEVQGNRFQIAGGTAGLKVSWQVTGIRNDPYAQQHRIPVEEPKPPAERGTYVYPEGYGQPATSRVGGASAAPMREAPRTAPGVVRGGQ